MSNARETLRKSPVADNVYLDVKYVKTAFGIAYLGVLEATRLISPLSSLGDSLAVSV